MVMEAFLLLLLIHLLMLLLLLLLWATKACVQCLELVVMRLINSHGRGLMLELVQLPPRVKPHLNQW